MGALAAPPRTHSARGRNIDAHRPIMPLKLGNQRADQPSRSPKRHGKRQLLPGNVQVVLADFENRIHADEELGLHTRPSSTSGSIRLRPVQAARPLPLLGEAETATFSTAFCNEYTGADDWGVGL